MEKCFLTGNSDLPCHSNTQATGACRSYVLYYLFPLPHQWPCTRSASTWFSLCHCCCHSEDTLWPVTARALKYKLCTGLRWMKSVLTIYTHYIYHAVFFHIFYYFQFFFALFALSVELRVKGHLFAAA